MDQHPLIIWTLQRTGGTNFGHRIMELSDLSGTQHEPFNLGRIYGNVTKQWLDSRDDDSLADNMAAICSKRMHIKHCVETVPWEVTSALINASCSLDYRHVFLFRKQSVGRLLSLHFARLSGVWGPNMKDQEQLDNKIFSEPIPIAKLVRHEEKCQERLRYTWRALDKWDAHPMAIAYEDLYQTNDFEQRYMKIQEILKMVGLSVNDTEDRAFIDMVIGKGDQGTRDKYSRFKGIEGLQEKLKDIKLFNQAKILVNDLWRGSGEVKHAQIDEIKDGNTIGEEIIIGGVVVLNENIKKEVSLAVEYLGKSEKVHWGIESPWMAKKYPDSSNSANSRFEFRYNPEYNGVGQIILKEGNDNQRPLFKLAYGV